MYFLEPYLGESNNLCLFDLKNNLIKKINKTVAIEKQTYCFDIYKLYNIYGKNLPFVFDLQSLEGLRLNKKEQLDELFDQSVSRDYLFFKQRINAHIKSYTECKINFSNFSIDDLMPQKIIDGYYKNKLKCLIHYFNNNSIDQHIVKFYEDKFEEIKHIMYLSDNDVVFDDKKIKIKYQIFGSKNSRLSIKNKNHNVYNIPKEKRNVVSAPEKYTLFQFDFKSFQPKLALSVFGDEQIKDDLRKNEDIYSIFEGNREENKIELISWMFSKRKNEKFDNKLKCIVEARKKIYNELKNGMILNYFGRPLFFTNEEENVVFQNLICSLEADCMLSLIKDIQNKLKDSKSYVYFPFHDCLVLAVFNEEINKINDLKMFIEDYLYDRFFVKFAVTIKAGKDFKNMKNFN